MVRGPRLVPRVAVIQVAPTPTTVASNSASRVMNSSRTVGNDQSLGGAEGAALAGVAAAKLSGYAMELDETGLTDFTGSPEDDLSAVLAASSSIFSTWTRISAPRLVSTGGGPGFISGGFGAPAAAVAAGGRGGGGFLSGSAPPPPPLSITPS